MATAAAATVLTLIAIATLLGCLWLWLLALLRAIAVRPWLPAPVNDQLATWLRGAGVASRLPYVPWTTRRAVPWAFLDLLLLAGIWVLVTLVASTVLRGLGFEAGSSKLAQLDLRQRALFIAGNIVVSLAILGIGLPLTKLRTGSTSRDFGWSWDNVGSDLRLGVIGFVMLAPPVYALQGLLVTIWKPSTHPLMEMFKGTPDASFFGLLFVSAVFVAPLFEELIFRVVIQGFLEKWFSFSVPLPELLVGGRHSQVFSDEATEGSSDVSLRDMPLPLDESPLPASANPYAPPLSALPVPASDTRVLKSAEQPELRGSAAWLPISMSAAIFALLHFSHGPDWIPLLLLAAGMGYLYQRTHRLLPSLTVHALLNALSMCALWVQVNADK